ncbi:hypothetical protein BC834DRAFT_852391 [Gloeopeniophorella convolvens]|nr:hypothetical protein BC834DRAFT_852391 [Gloeopeniophorella convolvens]
MGSPSRRTFDIPVAPPNFLTNVRRRTPTRRAHSNDVRQDDDEDPAASSAGTRSPSADASTLPSDAAEPDPGTAHTHAHTHTPIRKRARALSDSAPEQREPKRAKDDDDDNNDDDNDEQSESDIESISTAPLQAHRHTTITGASAPPPNRFLRAIRPAPARASPPALPSSAVTLYAPTQRPPNTYAYAPTHTPYTFPGPAYAQPEYALAPPCACCYYVVHPVPNAPPVLVPVAAAPVYNYYQWLSYYPAPPASYYPALPPPPQ